MLCIQLILFLLYSTLLMYFCERMSLSLLFLNQICCVCVCISEAVRSVSSAHVTAFTGVHLGERHRGGGAQGDSPLAAYIYSCPTLPPLNFEALFISS